LDNEFDLELTFDENLARVKKIAILKIIRWGVHPARGIRVHKPDVTRKGETNVGFISKKE